MFSKPTKGEPSSFDPVATRKPTLASLIAEGVTIRGDLITEGDLHLDGAVEGDVKVGHLTIGDHGLVTGVIHADHVEIRGHVVGTIAARQVRLWSTARVDGDISHTELAIEAGAHFEGRSLMLAREPATTPALPADGGLGLSAVAAE